MSESPVLIWQQEVFAEGVGVMALCMLTLICLSTENLHENTEINSELILWLMCNLFKLHY